MIDPLIPRRGDADHSINGSSAGEPCSTGGSWLRRGLGALAWLLLGRWLAVVLVLAAGLAEVVILILRLLWRDVLDLPRWHIARCDPLGLALQLAVQVPLGWPVAVANPVVYSLVTFPLFALIGGVGAGIHGGVGVGWSLVEESSGVLGLTTVLPWALAALPVWGAANGKAHVLCRNHFAAPAQRVLVPGSAGGGNAAPAVRLNARWGARLCDCFSAFKGGVLPIDRVALAQVRRELERGTAVDAVDEAGKSALHVAAALGLPRTAQALLDAGADPNMQDAIGATALHEAVRAFGACQTSCLGLDASSIVLTAATFLSLLTAGIAVLVCVRLDWFIVGGIPFGAWLILLGLAQCPLTPRVLKPSALASLHRTAEVLRDAPAADLSTTDNNDNTAMMLGMYALLAPQPAWADVERALGEIGADPSTAAVPVARTHPVLALLHDVRSQDTPLPSNGMQRLRLLDMLCGGDQVGCAEQQRRQQLVFVGLLVPLVRAAERRPLQPAKKKLLIAACEATARGRAQHRTAFDAIVGGAMATFEGELGAAYTALGASAAGRDLLALPTELLGDIAKADLSQCSEHVMGRAAWLQPPSLAGAYQALAGFGDAAPAKLYEGEAVVASCKGSEKQFPGTIAGDNCDGTYDVQFDGGERDPSVPARTIAKEAALRGIDDMCTLLQSGRHRWFAAAHAAHFNDPECWSFWLHVCALHSVARNEQRNAEFQARVKAIAATLGETVCYKEAPIKKYERVVVKAEQYHEKMRLPGTAVGAAEAVGRVIDIQRCSLEVNDAATAMKAVALLKGATIAEHGMRPLRCKNGFDAAAESAGGYRDVKLNMLFQAKGVSGAAGRAVVEIQVILKEYLVVKKRMHAVYRLDRGDFNGATRVADGALFACAVVGDLAGVQQRLDEGADIEERTDLLQGQHLAFSIDINRSGYRTPLSAAAEGGHLAVVEVLLQRGAKVDAWSGGIAVRLASVGGHKDVVRLLAKRGALLELANDIGDTALSCAAREGHLEVVRLLLELGVETDGTGGAAAVRVASLGGHSDVVRLLAEHGAPLDLPNVSADLFDDVFCNCRISGGNTALSYAAREGHLEVVRTLLELGAETGGKSGRRARRDAKGNDAIEQLLAAR
jgi:ankyrin repeat protein